MGQARPQMLLALDTSTPVTVLALADADPTGRLLASLSIAAPGKLEEGLLPLLEQLLELAGKDRRAIRTLAVGLGPGGYTSLRVGIATVKGLAVGLGASLVGIGSLRALARGVGSPHVTSAVFTDARRGEIYGAAYQVGVAHSTEIVAPVHGRLADVVAHVRARVASAPCIAVGDALSAYPELATLLAPSMRVAPPVMATPRPEALVLEAWSSIERGDLAPLDGLEPHYVKPSDAKLPLKPLRTTLAGID